MLELLAVVFSSLAVIWGRKNDIRQQILEPDSRTQLATALRHPADILTTNLRAFHSLISRFIGAGIRVFGFCLATSLAFSALSFLFAVVASSSSINELYLTHH